MKYAGRLSLLLGATLCAFASVCWLQSGSDWAEAFAQSYLAQRNHNGDALLQFRSDLAWCRTAGWMFAFGSLLWHAALEYYLPSRGLPRVARGLLLLGSFCWMFSAIPLVLGLLPLHDALAVAARLSTLTAGQEHLVLNNEALTESLMPWVWRINGSGQVLLTLGALAAYPWHKTARPAPVAPFELPLVVSRGLNVLAALAAALMGCSWAMSCDYAYTFSDPYFYEDGTMSLPGLASIWQSSWTFAWLTAWGMLAWGLLTAAACASFPGRYRPPPAVAKRALRARP